MLDQLQALWRPVTGLVMSGVVLAIALGLLPPSAEEHASALLTAAGGVLATLTASRAVQRVQEVKAQAAAPGVEEVTRQLRELQAELARIGQAVQR